MFLNIAVNPKMNDSNPAPHAVSIGMVRYKLLKKVFPPRWLKTLTIIKKYATNKIRSKKRMTDQMPDFVLGKNLIFIFDFSTINNLLSAVSVSDIITEITVYQAQRQMTLTDHYKK